MSESSYVITDKETTNFEVTALGPMFLHLPRIAPSRYSERFAPSRNIHESMNHDQIMSMDDGKDKTYDSLATSQPT